MKKIKFEEIKVGMRVFDEEGYSGIVDECNDIHNIFVTALGFSGLYCLDIQCKDYSPLYIEEIK